MELTVSGAELTITGDVKSFDDYLNIKETVKSLVFDKGLNALTIKVVNSMVITSSVIGFFIRLILKDKVKVSMYIQEEKLCELLNALNLGEIFSIRKI